MMFTLPIRIESANSLNKLHFMKRARKAKLDRTDAYWSLRAANAPKDLPVVIHLVRIAPKAVDAHDNLRSGFKATVDGIADYLGIQDNDKRVTWSYGQKSEKTYRVEVTFT